MTQIFISYSRKDIAFIEQLAVDLKFAGLDAWYDLSGLEGGARWSKEIEKAIRASEYVIVVLSPDSVASIWVEEEILYARNLKRKIVPLLYKPCEIPLGFHTINFIDVRDGRYWQNYKEILRALGINRSEREEAENAVHEKAEKDATKKARLIAEEEGRQRIAVEKAEREAAERIAKEKANRQASEKAKREREERQAARKMTLVNTFSILSKTLKSTFSKSKSILRVIGVVGIFIVLFWAGLSAITRLSLLIPKMQVTTSPLPDPTATFSSVLPATVTSTKSVVQVTKELFATETLTPIGTSQACDDRGKVINVIAYPDTYTDNRYCFVTYAKPNSSFTRTFYIKNVGSCTWSTDYALVYESGFSFGSMEGIHLPQSVAPGETVAVTAKFIAPDASPSIYGSNYSSSFALQNPDNEKVNVTGTRFCMDLAARVETAP